MTDLSVALALAAALGMAVGSAGTLLGLWAGGAFHRPLRDSRGRFARRRTKVGVL